MYNGRPEISVSAGAIVLTALLYFFDDSGIISAFVPAVAAHEAGHAIALGAQGAKIRRFTADSSGLRIDYSGDLGAVGEFTAAICGPLAGIAFAYAASFAGNVVGSKYLLCAAGLSLALSLFNLLPAMPLDGGRCLRALCGRNGDKALVISGAATAAALLATGLWLLRHGYGAGLLVAGVWIALEFVRDRRECAGIKQQNQI